MWLIARYEAVTLFSLRMSSATASGGKSLLAPTPYAIKMALLDAAFRVLGNDAAEILWPAIRDLQIALRPARNAVVNHLFQRMLKPRRSPPAPGDPDAGPFGRTIGYREYVQLQGSMSLAFRQAPDNHQQPLPLSASLPLAESGDAPTWLTVLLLNLNYLGKRGSFMQLIGPPETAEDLGAEFVVLTQSQTQFPIDGTMQVLDDCAPILTFAKAIIYSGAKVALGKERILRHIVLPYRLVQSSRSHSYFRVVEDS